MCGTARVKLGVPALSRRTTGHPGGLRLPGTIALLLLAIGGLNWGLVGLFDVDAVAWLLGSDSVTARIVYVAVGVAAAYCLARLPRWSRTG